MEGGETSRKVGFHSNAEEMAGRRRRRRGEEEGEGGELVSVAPVIL